MPKRGNRGGSAAQRKGKGSGHGGSGQQKQSQPRRQGGGGKYAERQRGGSGHSAGEVPRHIAQQLEARGVPEKFFGIVVETADRHGISPLQAWERVGLETRMSAMPAWNGLSSADREEVLRRALEGRQTAEEILAETRQRREMEEQRQATAKERMDRQAEQRRTLEERLRRIAGVLREEGFSERQQREADALARQGKSAEEIFLQFRLDRAKQRLKADGHPEQVIMEAGGRLAEQGLRPTGENIIRVLNQMEAAEMRAVGAENHGSGLDWDAIRDIAERAEEIRQKHARRLTDRGVAEALLEQGVDRIMTGEPETAVARDLAKRGRGRR